MNEAEAVGIIQDAIDYILLIRESSGADDGELDLAGNLERVVQFIQSGEVRKGRDVQQF